MSEMQFLEKHVTANAYFPKLTLRERVGWWWFMLWHRKSLQRTIAERKGRWERELDGKIMCGVDDE